MVCELQRRLPDAFSDKLHVVDRVAVAQDQRRSVAAADQVDPAVFSDQTSVGTRNRCRESSGVDDGNNLKPKLAGACTVES